MRFGGFPTGCGDGGGNGDGATPLWAKQMRAVSNKTAAEIGFAHMPASNQQFGNRSAQVHMLFPVSSRVKTTYS
jgi:hypothetical protein